MASGAKDLRPTQICSPDHPHLIEALRASVNGQAHQPDTVRVRPYHVTHVDSVLFFTAEFIGAHGFVLGLAACRPDGLVLPMRSIAGYRMISRYARVDLQDENDVIAFAAVLAELAAIGPRYRVLTSDTAIWGGGGVVRPSGAKPHRAHAPSVTVSGPATRVRFYMAAPPEVWRLDITLAVERISDMVEAELIAGRGA